MIWIEMDWPVELDKLLERMAISLAISVPFENRMDKVTSVSTTGNDMPSLVEVGVNHSMIFIRGFGHDLMATIVLDQSREASEKPQWYVWLFQTCVSRSWHFEWLNNAINRENLNVLVTSS